jgi:hypothetical protein
MDRHKRVLADGGEDDYAETWGLLFDACGDATPVTLDHYSPVSASRQGWPRLPGVAPCLGKGGSRLIPHGSAHCPAAKKFVAIA